MRKRRLILNCDDFGQCTAANEAIQNLLEDRKVSSATIMPPAPAFAEAADWVKRKGFMNVGLHLTLTSEIEGYRWGSLTGAPSLSDESFFLPKTNREFEERAKPKEVVAEIEAQFEAVKTAGLSSRMSIIIWAACMGLKQDAAICRKSSSNVHVGGYRFACRDKFMRKMSS